MIKTYCDFCQKEINDINYQVNLDFNSFCCPGFSDDYTQRREYQFHGECATRVRNKIEEFLMPKEHQPTEKGGSE